MMRLHSLVCFQRSPFPCCHFLSCKHASIVFPAVKHSGDARRLTATCTSALYYNTALQPGPTPLPVLPAPSRMTPATDPFPARRNQARSCLISQQVGVEKNCLCALVCSLVQSVQGCSLLADMSSALCGHPDQPHQRRQPVAPRVVKGLDTEEKGYSCSVPTLSHKVLWVWNAFWKSLCLCLSKKFKLLQGSRMLCSLGSHLPSLTNTGL